MNLADLLADADRSIHTIGTVTVTGTLADWHQLPSGLTVGELTSSRPIPARIRVIAGRHAAAAASDELRDAGRHVQQPGEVTITGQLHVHPVHGLQLTLYRLEITHVAETTGEDDARPNATTRWPPHITTIGLVAPDGGDDALADVHAICDPAGIDVVDHRVPFTGQRAPITIAHALDLLALDPRPHVTLLVRGGGPSSDFAACNHRIVIAAIGRHPRPVICGVGHATNRTGADRAAHTSCITPTAAAQLACADPPHTAPR